MRKYSWTPAEDKFIEDNYALLGPKKCCEAMGRAYNEVKYRAGQLCVRMYRQKRSAEHHKLAKRGLGAMPGDALAELVAKGILNM